MIIRLPYGKGFVKVHVPDQAHVVYPRELPGVTDVRAEMRRAMDHPSGCVPSRQLAVGKSDALVVINKRSKR